MPVDVSSYLIRMWRETDPQPAPGWRYEVEHIQSGRRWSFETTKALLAFMASQAETPPDLGGEYKTIASDQMSSLR
jgi:hypothetical protein